jgi:predicted secreted acid phosphatase
VKKIVSLLLVSALFATFFANAKEPANIDIAKQKLIKYHDSGAYLDDIADVAQKALRYLELRIKRGDFNGKPAIILDIDETSLSNFPHIIKLNFGGTPEEFQALEDKGTDKPIEPTLKLYRFAKMHHIAVFFITGRFEEERQVTEENLKKAGFTQFDGLVLRAGPNRTVPAAIYKTAIRKELQEKGYDILLNIGDQKSDLQGGYADETFKLPNPYYLIP